MNAEWGCAVVLVNKQNSGIRLCGDLKTSLNPNLNIEHYPLPRIENLFQAAAGGAFLLF